MDMLLATPQQWEECFDGPKPIHETIECSPYLWYTQQWWNCALLSQKADFDEDELLDLFDYHFDYDSTIHSGDFLNLYQEMSTSSEYNMLRLEAPRGLLQITNDEEPQEETLEIANPVGWMQAMANHQQQAK